MEENNASRGDREDGQKDRTSRRRLLRTALGAAAATVGAGALLETQTRSASAASTLYESAQNSGNVAIEAHGYLGANAIYATCDNTSGTTAIAGQVPQGSGTGVQGYSQNGFGVYATSGGGTGLFAGTASATGVALQAVANDSVTVPTSGVAAAIIGDGGSNTGIYGTTTSNLAGAAAIHGKVNNSAPGLLSAGVWGESQGGQHQGAGVLGTHNGNGDGVFGSSQSGGRGVVGTSVDYYGVYADGGTGTGLYAIGLNSGISAYNSGSGVAIFAINNGASPSISAQNSGTGNALTATSTNGVGIAGTSSGAHSGVAGTSAGANGVFGTSNAAASIGAAGVKGVGTNGYGGFFQGGLAPLRLAPATTAGAPMSGSHHQGELFVDKNGVLYFCTVSGTPGTWKTVQLV